MKHMRSILFTVFSALAGFSAVTYTACHKDKCVDVACLNKGACSDGNCTCLAGYEGLRCDTLSRKKFIATYNGGDICSDSNNYSQYPLYFLSVPTKPLELKIKNFLNNPDDSAVATMRSIDSFTFLGANNSTTYSGTGTLRLDTLKLIYYVQQDTIAYDCKYVGGSLR